MTAPNTSLVLTADELAFIARFFNGSKSEAIHTGLMLLQQQELAKTAHIHRKWEKTLRKYATWPFPQIDYQEIDPDTWFCVGKGWLRMDTNSAQWPQVTIALSVAGQDILTNEQWLK